MNRNHFQLILSILLTLNSHYSLFAQDTMRLKFGEISKQDFILSSPILDSNASAVVLADVGSAVLEANSFGFQIKFTRHKRIKILNKNGYSAASFSIHYSSNENGTGKLRSLEANTYNIENGEIEQSNPLDEDIFIEKLNDNIQEEKFVFPNVKEGSIIEYKYSIVLSNLNRLHPWDFQSRYPTLYSDFKVTIPDLFNYVFLMQGSHTLYKKTIETENKTISFASRSVKSEVSTIRWIMKDIPALHDEPYVSTTDNYINGIRFQLSEKPISTLKRVRVLESWKAVTDRFLNSPYFGAELNENNAWLKKDLKEIVNEGDDEIVKAKKIFAFVRDNFTADNDGVFANEGLGLREIMKKRRGNVPELNLLLTAMLRMEKIKADPVILSTRENGLTNIVYPIMENYNYVIVRVNINDVSYCLDASKQKLGFGKLPLNCYNGHARVIATEPSAVYFKADSLTETKITEMKVYNNDTERLSGYYTTTMGYYESFNLRNSIGNNVAADYLKRNITERSNDFEIDHAAIDSLSNYDVPATLHYHLKIGIENSNLLYINPMLNTGIKNNPFTAATRENPIEMPYASHEMFSLTMEVPKGYKIDQLPKSVKVLLNEDDGLFEYSISKINNTIKLTSSIILNRANFTADDYQSLRDFYAYIIKKQSEVIVFKKE